jgi:hypothetical protein
MRLYWFHNKQEGLGRNTRLLSFDTTTSPPEISRCRGNVFTELSPSNVRWIHRHPQTLLWHDTDLTENDSSNSSCFLCIHYRCNVFTELLPSNMPVPIQIHRLMGGVYEVGLGVIVYKDCFRHSKVNRGGIHRQHEDRISLVLFLQNKESRLKVGQNLHIQERDPIRKSCPCV